MGMNSGKSGLLYLGCVEGARGEATEFMRRIGLFETVPIEDCSRQGSRAPISAKRVDDAKGSEERLGANARLERWSVAAQADKLLRCQEGVFELQVAGRRVGPHCIPDGMV